MSIGFALLGQLIFILLICMLLGLAAATITFLFGKKRNRLITVAFAFISPFVLIGSFYAALLTSTIILSEITETDCGIGDCWYVPLDNHYRLTFIDVTEVADLSTAEQTLLSHISHLTQRGDTLAGYTANGTYFLCNTLEKKLTIYSSKTAFRKKTRFLPEGMQTAFQFYLDRKTQLLSWRSNAAIILSLLFSAGCFLGLIKLKKWQEKIRLN